MTYLAAVFLSVIALFFLLLLGKEITGRKFCAICASIAGTWTVLLIFYRLNGWGDPLLIALLLGQSITGIYYLLEAKMPERLTLFRLPFILTATLLGYFLLGGEKEVGAALLLALLWLGFGMIYAWRARSSTGEIFKRIVACCRNW